MHVCTTVVEILKHSCLPIRLNIVCYNDKDDDSTWCVCPGYSLSSRGDNENAFAAYATLQFSLDLLALFDDDARLTRGYYETEFSLVIG